MNVYAREYRWYKYMNACLRIVVEVRGNDNEYMRKTQNEIQKRRRKRWKEEKKTSAVTPAPGLV